MAKKNEKKPREGLTGSMGKTVDDDVVDSAFTSDTQPLKEEATGGVEKFEEDTDRQPLASGGVKRGEALQPAEEEDDFEDGRTSSGLRTRSQEDMTGIGDAGRAIDADTGYLGREGEGGSPSAPA